MRNNSIYRISFYPPYSCRSITLPVSLPLKHPSHSLKYICFLINSKLLTLQLDYETYETTI